MTSAGITDFGGERLVGVGEPTNPDHAATKHYVDTNSGGGSSPVVVGTKLLTSAQIKALHASSIALDGAPAPGAGKGYLVLGVFSQAFPGGTPYTTPDNSRVEVGPQAAVDQDYSTWETQTPGDSGANGPTALVVNGANDSDCAFQWSPSQDPSTVGICPSSLIENQPLAVGNPGDEFTDGDGTLYIAVTAAIVDVVT